MGSLGVALRRGIDDTATRLAPHALRWLWLYTLELPPMLFARRAACHERRPPRRSAVPPIAAAPGVLRADAWRVPSAACTEQRRGAQSAAASSAPPAPPADAASASAPLCAHTPFEQTRADVLAALDALAGAPPTAVRPSQN